MARGKKSIDIGLAVLSSVNRHGQALTAADIGDVCGCSANAIFELEKRALRRFRLIFAERFGGNVEDVRHFIRQTNFTI